MSTKYKTNGCRLPITCFFGYFIKRQQPVALLNNINSVNHIYKWCNI